MGLCMKIQSKYVQTYQLEHFMCCEHSTDTNYAYRIGGLVTLYLCVACKPALAETK